MLQKKKLRMAMLTAQMVTTTKRGMYCALFAYTAWGVLPLYWKFLRQIPALDLLIHRILWSCLFLLAIVAIRRHHSALWQLARKPRNFFLLLLSSILISTNWFVYVLAVNSGHLLEASLGYFVNPLANTVIGVLIFKERLNRWQVTALVLAALGVGQLFAQNTSQLWISAFLVLTFCGYGVIRKVLKANTLLATTIESLLMIGPAFAYFCVHTSSLEVQINYLWLIGAGIVTILPIMAFAEAATLLPLSTLGFFQYISPSLQFLIAVLIFQEPMNSIIARAFVCIWIALLIYSADLRRRVRIPQAS
jgi:chloramphenicol-sensitive protein RarD